jgi:predicted CoA-binding protein
MTSIHTVHEFLAGKRLAMVGVSREPKDFSRSLFRELKDRGYEVIAVNPGAQEIEGQRCYGHLGEVDPPAENALLMTIPEVTGEAVKECAAAGVRRVWMYRAGGEGAVNPDAVRFCEQHEMAVIAGECPFMFLPNSGLIHRLHGWVSRMTGHYPI